MGCSSAAILLTVAAIAASSSAGLKALADADLRLASVAFRLQTAAVPDCTHRTALPGMVVDDIGAYRSDLRGAARAALGLSPRWPTVTGIVPGGPAARAGVREGDAIRAIDGTPPLPGLALPGLEADGVRATRLAETLDAAFARGLVRLTIVRGGRVRDIEIAGAPACASFVQLGLEPGRNAGADGRTVTVSRGLVAFATTDDELAFVVAHELAHDLLGQGATADLAVVADDERRADYLALYLMAWAGYDIDAPPRFWRWMPAGFEDASHPAARDRAAALAREADEIRARPPGRPRPDYEAFAVR